MHRKQWQWDVDRTDGEETEMKAIITFYPGNNERLTNIRHVECSLNNRYKNPICSTYHLIAHATAITNRTFRSASRRAWTHQRLLRQQLRFLGFLSLHPCHFPCLRPNQNGPPTNTLTAGQIPIIPEGSGGARFREGDTRRRCRVGCGKGGNGWWVAIKHFGRARSDGCIVVLSRLEGERGSMRSW